VGSNAALRKKIPYPKGVLLHRFGGGLKLKRVQRTIQDTANEKKKDNRRRHLEKKKKKGNLGRTTRGREGPCLGSSRGNKRPKRKKERAAAAPYKKEKADPQWKITRKAPRTATWCKKVNGPATFGEKKKGKKGTLRPPAGKQEKEKRRKKQKKMGTLER